MLFSLKELDPSAEAILRQFFSNYGKLRPALDLYMSTVYHPEQLVRVRFLTLAQCIEAYHRVTAGGKYMPDDEYNDGLKNILLNALPAQLHDPAVVGDHVSNLDLTDVVVEWRRWILCVALSR